MPKLTILAVDDSADLRMLMEEIFDDHEVVTANDGVDALEIFTEHLQNPQKPLFDVVVTDLEMPRRSGDALILEIRKLAPSQPCLLVSGNRQLLTRAEAVLGVPVLDKPYSIETFTRVVKQLAAGEKITNQ